MVESVTDSNFEKEVINNSKPVLVDFWAEWCGPCKMLAPVLEDVAKDMEGKVDIVKMDVDKNPETPSKHGIRSIPTLMLFKDGKVVATKVGASSKEQLLEWIQEKA
jgi:thioredoxin 1